MTMKGLNWSIIAIVLVTCHLTIAAPSIRVKRQDELSLDPLSVDDVSSPQVDREKRKLTEAKFQSKNAVLGFVFGKLNQFIDAKTRFVDQLDKSNIEKNKQYGIEPPQPIPNFQSLISGVITPKISAITQKFGSLSGTFGSVLGGSSSSSSSGSGNSDSDDASGGSAAGGLGGIVSSVLRLSGPLLSASLGGGSAGSSSGSFSDSDSTPEPDDDF